MLGLRARRALIALGLLAAAGTGARAQSVEELRSLSIEQLATIDVTSVLRRPEPLSEAAAAIYVITAEDIRRSGAITLPQVLRLAPNLDVAQDTAQTWAMSARGFNSTSASNKILVLIDGRPVYAPVFGSVFWDQQQVPMDDIARVEVISGPGGTQWGANAFNGVVNVVTKSSRDTQGGLVDLKAGPVDQYGLVQYGGHFGADGTYRVYGQGFGIGSTDLPNHHSAGDQWHGGQFGFRTDWRLGPNQVLAEGDLYRNNNALDGRQYGGDLMARWTRQFDNGGELQVQTSYDSQDRVTPGFSDSYQSYDLQTQYTQRFGRNVVVVGGEYRLMAGRLLNNANPFHLVPAARTVGVADVFVQDTFAITPKLKVTAGVKVEQSAYSGVDLLPSIRLGWTVSDKAFLWAAVSRAVRTPSRLDRELTAAVIVAPSPNFLSEKLTAYELGYRGRPTADTSLSVSLYYNVYSDLRSTGLSPINGYLFQLQNGYAGHTFGMETWGSWSVRNWWRLSAGANLQHRALHLKSGFVDISGGQSEGWDPGYQLFLRSSMDLPHHLEVDVGLRGIGDLTGAPIHGYVQAEAKLAWHATDRLEISIAGQNLFAPDHAETVTPGSPIYLIRRSVYLGLRTTF